MIRSGRPDDLPAIADLLGPLFRTTYAPIIGSARTDALNAEWHAPARLNEQLDPPGTSFLVAEEDGRVLGHGFASAIRPTVLFVARLYVVAGHQRGGLGSRMLADLVERQPAAEIVRLFVAEGNAAASAFYRRRGFVEAGRTEEGGFVSIRIERRLAG